MRNKHKLKIWFYNLFNVDKVILFIILLLFVINIFIQYSASEKSISKVIVDIEYLVISLSIMLIVSNLNRNTLNYLALPLYLITNILLILVLLKGVSSHGAKRWINIGLKFQPSELCKLVVPLMLAYYFNMKNNIPRYYDYLVGLIIIIIPLFLIVKQPDLGTGILVLFAGLFVLFYQGISWKVVIGNIIIAICGAPIIWHFLYDYQKHRIITLINPQSDKLGKGYHIIQGIIGIGSGGLTGKGYLSGTQIHLD